MRIVFTYWEGPVTWLERLSIHSMLDAGHKVVIYTCDPRTVRNHGLPAEVIDLRDAVSLPPLAFEYRKQRHFSLFADIVRLALLKRGAGIWSDADCLFQRALPDAPALMGWMTPSRINNALLYLEQDSPLLHDYFDAITAVPVRVPWATGHIRIRREIGVALGIAVPRSLQRMSIGPRALTYFVRRHGLENAVAPKERFYPIVDTEAAALVDPDDGFLMSRITPATDVVHGCRGMLALHGLLDAKPPASSFAGRECSRLGV
jgi:hypothetical protein